MAERVKQEPRESAKKAEETIKQDLDFEGGERILSGSAGVDTKQRADESFAPGLENRYEGQTDVPKKKETDL